MADPLPRRLAGYGAYNLCFDKMLGRLKNTSDPDFFHRIRQLGFGKINLVRVICFRYSRKENLPHGRAIPLYVNNAPGGNPPIIVNEAFLKNLNDLVTSAQQLDFWVQVSIFHYHAIATPGGGSTNIPEVPELLPVVLRPEGATAVERLKAFFNPTPAKPQQLARQLELVDAVVTRLKGRPKVIYEIGNELRIDKGGTRDDNFRLAEWMNIVKARILSTDPGALVGTSTGRQGDGGGENEEEVFHDAPHKLVPNYFDFHSQEWIDDETTPRIMAAANRAKTYLGITTTPPLIIDDDGLHDVNRTAANIRKWASAAFGQGLHYSNKGTYPNGGVNDTDGKPLDFDLELLKALNDVARTTPFPP